MQQQQTQHEEQHETSTAPVVTFSELEIVVSDDLDAVKAEWLRLQRFNRNSLHQGFDWCRAWAQAHGSTLAIVEGRATGRTMFLLPLEITAERGVRIARFLGGRFNNINTGLFDTDFGMPTADDLLMFERGLRDALKSRADLVALDNFPLTWRGIRHPLTSLAAIDNQNHSFQLPLFADFEATSAQLNAKSRRKKFRNQMRRLEALGGFDHVVPQDAAEKHALLDLFFRQKGERLAAFGLPDVFHDPKIRDFFHRLLDVPADGTDAPLMLHAIRLRGEHEGHIPAIAALSRKGDHVICQFSSIDDSVAAEASPGELLFWLMIETSCHAGAGIFDFGVGDQPYKRSWCSQETVQHDILLPVTWKGALTRPLLVGVTRAKAAIKRNPTLYAITQRWRAKQCVKASEAGGSDAD